MAITNWRFAISPVASSGLAAALLSSFALAQTSGETKVPSPLPPLRQEKIAPVLPPKEPSTRPTPSSSDRVPAARPPKSVLPPNASHARPRRDPTKVYFDASGDGSIWARGASYKASFGKDGATYVPFLGSSAPQDDPISFALKSIEVDGRAVGFVTEVPATRSNETIVFDRGSVQETYQLQPEGLEQTFVFDALPTSGDLVVRVAVESEFSGLETADGLRFSNELGGVGYGRALAYDAGGHTTPATAHLEGNSIVIRVPAEFLSAATLPVTIDPLVSTFGVDTTINDDFDADVAFSGTTGAYGVVWEEAFSATDHDVWFEEFTTGGAAIGASLEPIDTSSNDWAQPRIAHNELADNFMTVAQVGISPGRIIRGRITASFSPYTETAKFDVSTGASGTDEINADIGGDPALTGPTYYMVTWEDQIGTGDHDIYARTVDSSGTLRPLIQVDSSTAEDNLPSISKCDGQPPFATQRWTIAWERTFSAMDHDIWGAQYLWDGSLVNATFPIDSSTNDDHLPQPSSLLDGSSTRDYLVVYQESNGSTNDIVGQICNETSLIASANISAIEAQGFQAEDQIEPAVDSDGDAYTVAYSEQFGASSSDYDLYLASVAKNGFVLQVAERHVNADDSSAYSYRPQITSTHSGGGGRHRFMSVWTDASGGSDDVEGALYEAGTFASFCFPSPGDIFDSAHACPCGNPAATGHGCNNSASTGGAILTSTGTASLTSGSDTVTFTSSGEKPTALSVFAQGTTPIFNGVVAGQGVRCVGGTLKRLYKRNASGGVVTAGFSVGDPPVHVRSSSLGDPISPGSARYYFVYYRDPSVLGGCPAGSTFNCTQAGSLIWYP
jgi:hypothetical protein